MGERESGCVCNPTMYVPNKHCGGLLCNSPVRTTLEFPEDGGSTTARVVEAVWGTVAIRQT